jgi:hypothetical protein
MAESVTITIKMAVLYTHVTGYMIYLYGENCRPWKRVVLIASPYFRCSFFFMSMGSICHLRWLLHVCICVKSCFAIMFSLTKTFWSNDCIDNCHLRWLLTYVIICLSCTHLRWKQHGIYLKRLAYSMQYSVSLS